MSNTTEKVKQTRKEIIHTCVYLLISLALVGIDALIKYLAKTYLMSRGRVTLIPKVVALNYAENTGAAFSSFMGNKWVLVGLTSVFIVLIIACLIKRVFKTRVEIACMIMVIGGGIGNLIDRIFQGFVVDYIEVLFVKFAIFNFADMLVVVGCFLFAFFNLYLLIREQGKTKKDKVENKTDENTSEDK